MLDDGRGFIADGTYSGMGLRIMAYRARMIGGKIEVLSSRDRGTKVVCTVPL